MSGSLLEPEETWWLRQNKPKPRLLLTYQPQVRGSHPLLLGFHTFARVAHRPPNILLARPLVYIQAHNSGAARQRRGAGRGTGKVLGASRLRELHTGALPSRTLRVLRAPVGPAYLPAPHNHAHPGPAPPRPMASWCTPNHVACTALTCQFVLRPVHTARPQPCR